MARIRPFFRSLRLFSCTRAWCAQVAAQPDRSRISVLIKRQVPGVERLDPDGRPGAVDRRALRPHRIQAVLEEGPEPGHEEHHFGHDEEDEAVFQAQPHDRRVIARMAFVHHFGPPGVHDVQHPGEADQRQPVGPQVVDKAIGRVRRRVGPVHPEDRAEQHQDRGTQPLQAARSTAAGRGSRGSWHVPWRAVPSFLVGQFSAPSSGAADGLSAACSSGRGVSWKV